jgi:hypothetical protein
MGMSTESPVKGLCTSFKGKSRRAMLPIRERRKVEIATEDSDVGRDFKNLGKSDCLGFVCLRVSR